MRLQLKHLAVFVFMFSLVSLSIPWINASNGDGTSLEVAEAEEKMVLAYEVVFEAEEAGANVTGLLDTLQVASEYLAEAYLWDRLGVSVNSSRFAGLCYDLADDVQGDALELRNEAKNSLTRNDSVVMLGSLVGIIVVVALGFVSWRIFNRRYHKKTLRLKPEVVK
jgi:hypothetical protein